VVHTLYRVNAQFSRISRDGEVFHGSAQRFLSLLLCG
jgi:hypothetical protein